VSLETEKTYSRAVLWIRIRIQGFDDQKLKEKKLEKFLNFFLIKNCNLLIPRPPTVQQTEIITAK
jgi:hypothetical protein